MPSTFVAATVLRRLPDCQVTSVYHSPSKMLRENAVGLRARRPGLRVERCLYDREAILSSPSVAVCLGTLPSMLGFLTA